MGENIMELNEKRLLELVSKGLTWSGVLGLIGTLTGGVVSITTAAVCENINGKLEAATQVYAATNETYKKECAEALEKLGVDINHGRISRQDYDQKVEDMSSTDAIIQHILNNKNTDEKTKTEIKEMVEDKEHASNASMIGVVTMMSAAFAGTAATLADIKVSKELKHAEERTM